MNKRLVSRCLAACVVGLLGAVACSEYKPGTFEGGGRVGGPITIGGAGSNCTPTGVSCTTSDECCSHDCQFNGAQLVCVGNTDAAPQCKALNAGCATSSECCSTFCSPGQLCATPPIPDSGGGG